MSSIGFFKMWYNHSFESGKYYASVHFYPNGLFGFMFRGNIYDDDDTIIGDFWTNDSNWLYENFEIF